MFEETPPGSLQEADAALTSPGETVEAEPSTEPQPRDDAGRFTSTAPTTEPEAPDGEPVQPETPEEPTEPEGEVPEDDSPVVYRADGQEWEIPGSAVGDDGIFIPADQVPEVQQLLSAGKAAFGSVRERLSDAAAREQQALDRAIAAEAQAQTILAKFEEMVEKSQGFKTIEDLANSPIGQWLLGVAQNWPILKAQSQAKAIELQNKSVADRLKVYEEREQQAKLQPLIEDNIRQSIRVQAHELGLDEPTQNAVFERLRKPEFREYVTVKAPYDDLAQGFKRGDLVMNHSAVRQALELASINRGAQQKIAEAVKQNAAQQTKPKIPPTVGGKRAPKQYTVPVMKTAKDADDYLLHGDLSQFEPEE